MDPSSDYQLVLKYSKEIASRIEKQTAMADILSIFIRRISLYLINKNIVEVLLSLIKNGRKSQTNSAIDLGTVAEQFMKA
jgi:hypothetical protein